jgi:hypothetical protein
MNKFVTMCGDDVIIFLSTAVAHDCRTSKVFLRILSWEEYNINNGDDRNDRSDETNIGIKVLEFVGRMEERMFRLR